MTGSPLETWDREYRVRGPLWSRHKEVAHLLAHIPEKGQVLDAGCGSGVLIPLLAVRGNVVVGLDLSIEALRQSKIQNPKSKIVVHGTVTALPFRDGTFAGVVAVDLLTHLLSGERARAAAELMRVTAPGGVVAVEEFAAGDLREGRGKRIEARTIRTGDGITRHFFAEGELETLFGGLGITGSGTTDKPIRFGAWRRRRVWLAGRR